MSTPIVTQQNEGSLHFNKYCRTHAGRIADPHDQEHQRFFEEIDDSRDLYFNSSLELYRGVILRSTNLHDRGFVDFAQEGLVVKLHINSTKSRKSTLRRARSRKNFQLREAQDFFEELTSNRFHALRIDKVYENGLWTVRTVDVTNPHGFYSKL